MSKLIKYTLILFFTIALQGKAQVNPYVQPFFKKFTTDDYNLGPQNWGMAQMKNGNVLIANNEGLLEYDGTSFRVHRMPTGTAVFDIKLSNDTLYTCGQDEFGYFVINKEGEFTYHSLAEKIRQRLKEDKMKEFRKLFVTTHGIYFASFEKIYKKKGDDTELLYAMPGAKNAYSVYEVNDDLYFTYDSKHLLKLSKNGIDTIWVNTEYLNFLRGITETADGNLLLFRTNGVYELSNNEKGEKQIALCTKIKKPETDISYAVQLSDKIVMVSEHNMYYLDKKDLKVTRILTDEVYKGKIAGIIQDSNKNEWLLLDNGFGVVFSSYPVDQSLPSLPIDGLIYDMAFTENIIWISHTHGLLKLEYNPKQGKYDNPQNMSTLNDQYFEVQEINYKNGKKRYAVSAKGLYEISADNKKLKQLNTIPSTKLYDPGQDYDWVLQASINYVNVLKKDHNNNVLVEAKAVQGLSDQIRYIDKDSEDVLWLGTVYDGLYKLKPSGKNWPVTFRFDFYNPEHGLTDTETHLANVDGKILITQDYGLAEYDKQGSEKNRFKITEKYNKIFTENKMAVFQYVYNKHTDQMIMITYGDRGDLVEGIVKKNNSYSLITDLFRTLPARKLYNVHIDKENNFWLGGERMVYRIRAGFEKYDTKKKNYTNLRHISINTDSTVYKGNNLLLTSDEPVANFDKIKEINFEFSSLVIFMQEKVQYSYYLEGYEDTWSQWTSDNKKEYTNLSHGKYTFRVRSRDVFGNISESAFYAFVIATPWYLMWWAYTLYALLFVTIVAVSVKVYSYKLQRENKLLEEKISLRTKEVVKQKNEIEQQKQAIEVINKNITDSIIYAQKIQNALLPNEDVFRTICPQSFIVFKPKDIVSGDYYWISDKDKYIFYATADCTGHGVPGGFMSMLGTALLNEIVDERKVEDCGEVLTLMREKIMQALKQAGDSESKDGMDMVLIRIDKNTLEMQYAAANNSFYVIRHCEDDRTKQSANSDGLHHSVRNDVLHEMQCDKMPVGVYHSEVKPFRTFTHQLQKGDTIYTYTDGYADQFGGDKGKKYTYKRLREKLLAISSEPMEKQKFILQTEFEEWRGQNEQTDDVCLIGIKL